MRPIAVLALLAPLALAACGHDRDRDKTVIVNPPTQTQAAPPQNNTVVVPGATKVCPAGYTTC
ncbi:MAG TPA: hypothetical protein VL966_10715 [Alphaproteobacteria bacterium]|nr:hypothetical protein [Alphaproteobacteria bacterium]